MANDPCSACLNEGHEVTLDPNPNRRRLLLHNPQPQEGELKAIKERLDDFQTRNNAADESLQAAQRKIRTQETLLEAAEKHRAEVPT